MPAKNKQGFRKKGGRKQNGKPRSNRPKLSAREYQNRGRAMATVRSKLRAQNPGVDLEKRLIRSFVLPGDQAPIRLPARTPKLTAVFPFEQVITETVASGENSYLVFMDPCFPLWRYSSASITGGYKLNFLFSSTSAVTNPVLPQAAGASTAIALTAATAATSSGNIGTPSKPTWAKSGVQLGSTSDSAHLWWYVPGNMSPLVQVVAAAGDVTNGAWELTVQHSPDGTSENSYTYEVTAAKGAAVTLIDAVLNVNYSPGGWYRLLSINCVTAPTTVTATTITSINVGWTSGGTLATPTAASFDGYLPVDNIGRPEFAVAPTLYEQCRINAGSFLFQNVTAALNKEGSVRAGVFTVKGKKPWSNNNTQIDYWGDVQPRLRYTGMLEKGLYTYLQPQMSKNSGEGFADSSTSTSAYAGSDPATHMMQLDKIDYYYWINFKPTATQTIQVTYVCHHETPNDSMLYTTGQCRLPYEAYRQAIISTQSILPFTENPIHIASLLAAAAQLARGAAANAWNSAKPRFNPLAHQAVDWLIPKYKNLAIDNKPRSPYS